MPPVSIWPAWIRYTATAAIGGGSMLVAMSLAFGDVKRDAADAREGVRAHEPRLNSLETRAARDDERWNQIRADIAEIKARLK